MHKSTLLAAAFGAAILLAGASAAPAVAADGAISMHGGSAAFVVGAGWGSGRLHYRGHSYALKIGGLSVGAIGVNSYDLRGTVENLHRASDIEGSYGALDASATAGAGAGVLDMRNEKGVVIHATSTTAGLKLSLAPSGLVITMRR